MATVDPLRTRILVELKYGSPLLGCRFDPSGRFLFVSAQDSTIQRFDLVTGERTPFVGHTGWVRSLAFIGNQKPPASPIPSAIAALTGGAGIGAFAAKPLEPFFLISSDTHGNVLWWEGHIPEPKPIRIVAAHDGWVRAVAVSPSGCTVATCGNDNLAKLWSSADGSPLRTLKGHDCHVYNLAFHPNRRSLVTADLKGCVKEWDAETGQHIRDLDAKPLHKYDTGFMADIGGIRGMSFDTAGTILACAGITNVSNAFAGVGNPLVVLFNWIDGKTRQFTPKDAFQGTGWGVHIHPAGFVLAAGGGGNGRIWFWKLEDGVNVHSLNVPTNVRDLTVHPDGTAFAVATFSGTAVVYTMTS